MTGHRIIPSLFVHLSDKPLFLKKPFIYRRLKGLVNKTKKQINTKKPLKISLKEKFNVHFTLLIGKE